MEVFIKTFLSYQIRKILILLRKNIFYYALGNFGYICKLAAKSVTTHSGISS